MMGVIKASIELLTMPLRCAGHLAEDISGFGDFDDSEALKCLFTCGISSVGKGVLETLRRSVDALDK